MEELIFLCFKYKYKELFFGNAMVSGYALATLWGGGRDQGLGASEPNHEKD